MVATEQIHCLIGRILDESITDRDVTRLIHASVSIAQGMFVTIFRKQMTHFASVGYTTASAATRCIEELFFPRKGVVCYEIHEYFKNHHQKYGLMLASDSKRSYKQLINRKLTQRFSEIYAEMDPLYTKLCRNVFEAVERSSRCIRVANGEGVYIPGTDERLSPPQTFFPMDVLLMQFSQSASLSDRIPDLLDKLLDALNRQAGYRPCLAVEEIILILRDYFCILHIDEYQQEQTACQNDSFRDIELERFLSSLIDRTANRIRSSVINSYILKGKCTEEYADGITRAIRVYLNEMMENDCRSFFDYYKEQFPSTDKDEYRKKHRPLFEYLVSRAQNELRAEAKRYADA